MYLDKNMKYFLILSTVLVTGLFAAQENPETGWSYEQSPLQAFTFIEILEIDGQAAEGDGTAGPPNATADNPDTPDIDESTCYYTGGCDVVGAFIDRDGEEVCVGWQYANQGEVSTGENNGPGWTTVPLNGAHTQAPGSEDQMSFGDIAYFKIWDASNESILDMSLSNSQGGWSDGTFYILN